jgi:AcrR family transcriptional regulator
MVDIAEAAGLGKGSLYGAFGDKIALSHRVFDEWRTAIVELAEQIPVGPDDEGTFARLSAYAQLMAANTAADTDRCGSLMAKGVAELAQHDPAVAGPSAETMKGLLGLPRTQIRAAQRNGDIDNNADPQQLAALLLTVLHGIEAVGKAGLDAQALRGIADTALAVLPRPADQGRPTIKHAAQRTRAELRDPGHVLHNGAGLRSGPYAPLAERGVHLRRPGSRDACHLLSLSGPPSRPHEKSPTFNRRRSSQIRCCARRRRRIDQADPMTPATVAPRFQDREPTP